MKRCNKFINSNLFYYFLNVLNINELVKNIYLILNFIDLFNISYYLQIIKLHLTWFVEIP